MNNLKHMIERRRTMMDQRDQLRWQWVRGSPHYPDIYNFGKQIESTLASQPGLFYPVFQSLGERYHKDAIGYMVSAAHRALTFQEWINDQQRQIIIAQFTASVEVWSRDVRLEELVESCQWKLDVARKTLTE